MNDEKVTPANAPRLEQYASASEVADRLGLSRQSANVLISNGTFSTLVVLPGKRDQYLVDRAELEKVAAARQGE